jgi:hypothetical protein
VFLRRRPRLESAQISALPGAGVFLSRIQAIFTRLKFSYHETVLSALKDNAADEIYKKQNEVRPQQTFFVSAGLLS